MNTLQEKYNKKIKPSLVKDYKLTSPMAAPFIEKLVINMGTGQESKEKQQMDLLKKDLATISGQAPSIRQAKKSIAGFGLREGAPVGLTTTLRGEKMYAFLEKLFAIVLPRIRDFRGVKTSSFDHAGNYTLGLSEYTVFPEIDLAKVQRVKGMEITITIKNSNREKSLKLLEDLGMPFAKQDQVR